MPRAVSKSGDPGKAPRCTIATTGLRSPKISVNLLNPRQSSSPGSHRRAYTLPLVSKDAAVFDSHLGSYLCGRDRVMGSMPLSRRLDRGRTTRAQLPAAHRLASASLPPQWSLAFRKRRPQQVRMARWLGRLQPILRRRPGGLPADDQVSSSFQATPPLPAVLTRDRNVRRVGVRSLAACRAHTWPAADRPCFCPARSPRAPGSSARSRPVR